MNYDDENILEPLNIKHTLNKSIKLRHGVYKIKKGKCIGGGTFGTVWKGNRTVDNIDLAFKIMKRDESVIAAMIQLLQLTHYDNLYDVLLFALDSFNIHINNIPYYVMVMPYKPLDGGFVLNLIYKSQLIKTNNISTLIYWLQYYYKLVTLVYYLHMNKMAHLDIKESNFLCDQSDFINSVRIADIDTICIPNNLYTEDKIPPRCKSYGTYMPPLANYLFLEDQRAQTDIFIDENLSYYCDIWSLSVMGLNMLNAFANILPLYDVSYTIGKMVRRYSSQSDYTVEMHTKFVVDLTQWLDTNIGLNLPDIKLHMGYSQILRSLYYLFKQILIFDYDQINTYNINIFIVAFYEILKTNGINV